MHAHSADASVQQFFHALKSWRKVRKTLPGANAPKRLRKYCSVNRARTLFSGINIWKSNSIRVKNNQLFLSNGRNWSGYRADSCSRLFRWYYSKWEVLRSIRPEKSKEVESIRVNVVVLRGIEI